MSTNSVHGCYIRSRNATPKRLQSDRICNSYFPIHKRDLDTKTCFHSLYIPWAVLISLHAQVDLSEGLLSF